MADLVPGTIVGGKYRIVAHVGGGGMGSVYEAVHLELGRKVALKVLRDELAKEPVLLERFTREAQAAAALGHPNIVQVTDFQTPADGSPFIVMEHVPGLSLQTLLTRDGKLAPERVATIGAQMCSALAVAHAAGIIHRDVKPANVVVCQLAAYDLVKMVDFGVAKLTKHMRLTQTGDLVGTLTYMSPEQAKGDKGIDGRSDVFSVGTCMYVALTGRLPFGGRTTIDVILAIAERKPQPIGELEQAVDAALVDIVDRAMAKKPAERFSAAEMATALETWVAGSRSGVPSSGSAAAAGASKRGLPPEPDVDVDAPTLVKSGPRS